jgi:hypothetical protein
VPVRVAQKLGEIVFFVVGDFDDKCLNNTGLYFCSQS